MDNSKILSPVAYKIKDIKSWNESQEDNGGPKSGIAVFDLSRADELSEQELRYFLHNSKKHNNSPIERKIEKIEISEPEAMLKALFNSITNASKNLSNLVVRIITPNDNDIRSEFNSIENRFSRYLMQEKGLKEAQSMMQKFSFEEYDFESIRERSADLYSKSYIDELKKANNWTKPEEGQAVVIALENKFKGKYSIHVTKLMDYDAQNGKFRKVLAKNIRSSDHKIAQDLSYEVNSDDSIAYSIVSPNLFQKKPYIKSPFQKLNLYKNNHILKNLSFMYKGIQSPALNLHFIRTPDEWHTYAN